MTGNGTQSLLLAPLLVVAAVHTRPLCAADEKRFRQETLLLSGGADA